MITRGSSVQLARGTKYLAQKISHLYKQVFGLNKKTITFHPILPLHQKKYYEVKVIDDFNRPDTNYPILFEYQKTQNKSMMWAIFVLAFGAADFITQFCFDESFAYKFYTQFPQQMYILDKGLQTFRKTRNKYFNFLGDKVLSQYDYNIKKDQAIEILTNKAQRQSLQKQEEKKKKQLMQQSNAYLNKFDEMVGYKK